jgi:3-oxoacyl-[acyl-carrier-protein] synthase-3
MDKKIYLSAISYYLPSGNLSNTEINQEFPEWTIDKISKKTGIHNRAVVGENEYVSDMAVQAANQLFHENAISPQSIDFILLCTETPDYLLPATACIIQERLGISTSAGALDFNLGCSGFVYGLSLAKGLIASGAAQNVLLLLADMYTKLIKKEDKTNRTIFGDAASAVIISAQQGLSVINDFVFGTDGTGARNLIVKNSGSHFDPTLPSEAIENYLYMNGREIFNFAVLTVPKLIDATLAKHQVTLDEVDLFIFHQANKYILDVIREKISIPETKFYCFLENCGNTVSSTIPIALREAIRENKIKTGDKVLLAGFGVGYSWAATILQF